mgnify:CR=1 FL=1
MGGWVCAGEGGGDKIIQLGKLKFVMKLNVWNIVFSEIVLPVPVFFFSSIN